MSQIKGIEFKVSIDAKEANKQIQEIQKRLQEMQKSQSYADRSQAQAGGTTSPQSERAQKVFKEHRERLLAISKEELIMAQRSADAAEKAIARAKVLVQMEGLSAEKKQKAQEILNSLLDKEVLARYKIIDLKDEQAAGGGGPPNPPGGVVGGADGGGGGAGVLSGMSRQGVMAVVSAAAGVAKIIGEYQQEKSRTTAGINQSLYRGSGVSDIMEGRGFDFATTGTERGLAEFNAQEAQKGMTLREGIGGAAGLALGIGGAGKAGAILGTTLGPLGTVIGGAAGLAAGSYMFGGQLVGGAKSMLAGEGFMSGVERARQLEYSKDVEANREAEIAKNPLKHRAKEFYNTESGRMLELGQMSGLSQDEIMSKTTTSVDAQGNFSFKDSGILSSAGGMYTQAQKFGAMQGIAGAGGSSAQMAQGQTALDLKRNYGIQSANELTGMLSGRLQSGQTLGVDSPVFKKVMSEAVSVGLDTSKMGIETEQFLKTTASFIMDSGARTESGMAAVASNFSSFVSDPSLIGIDNAKTAKEAFDKISRGGGGANSANIQLAELRKQFPTLDENQLLYLSQASGDEISGGGDPMLNAIAKQVGGVDKLGKGKRSANVSSMTYDKGLSDKHQNILERKRALEEIPMIDPEFRKQEMAAIDEEIAPIMAHSVAMGTNQGARGQALKDLMLGVSGTGEVTGTDKTSSIDIAMKRAFGMGDKKEINDAAAEQVMTKEIRKYEAEFTESVSNVAKTTADLERSLRKLNKTLEEQATVATSVSVPAGHPSASGDVDWWDTLKDGRQKMYKQVKP